MQKKIKEFEKKIELAHIYKEEIDLIELENRIKSETENLIKAEEKKFTPINNQLNDIKNEIQRID